MSRDPEDAARALAAAWRATPRSEPDVRAAIAEWLATARGLEDAAVTGANGRYHARARALARVDALGGVHVSLPIEAHVAVGASGGIESVSGGEPDAASRDEAIAFVRGLIANGAIAPEGGGPAPGATHRIVVDEKGRRVVRRARFS